jgi:predicted transposase/invertase (TIGR01784 family)
MLDYAIRIYRKFPNKQLRQIVIYLLPTNSPMVYETTFVTANTRHEFEVIRLWEQSPEVLQQWLGLLPLTVLAKTAEPEAMLRQVAQQIEQIKDQTQQRNLASSTAILAGLVLEQEIIERVLRSDMMRESSMYQAILAEGEAKGKAEGRAEGEAKARAEAEVRMRQVAQNMLRSGISIEMTAQLIGLTIAEVEALEEQPS